MHDSGIDPDVQAFLREHIESYEHLEVLLVLRRGAGQWWSAEQVAAKLRAAEDVIDEALRYLASEGLVVMDAAANPPRFVYDEAQAVAPELVDGLARAYDEQRLEVMRLMSVNAIERLRGKALRAFADAFLLGRGKKGG